MSQQENDLIKGNTMKCCKGKIIELEEKYGVIIIYGRGHVGRTW